jgi:hypothetical protein
MVAVMTLLSEWKFWRETMGRVRHGLNLHLQLFAAGLGRHVLQVDCDLAVLLHLSQPEGLRVPLLLSIPRLSH